MEISEARRWSTRSDWRKGGTKDRDTLVIRLSPAMREAWSAAAKRLGYRSLSQFVRHMTCERISELGMSDTLREITDELPATMKESVWYLELKESYY